MLAGLKSEFAYAIGFDSRCEGDQIHNGEFLPHARRPSRRMGCAFEGQHCADRRQRETHLSRTRSALQRICALGEGAGTRQGRRRRSDDAEPPGISRRSGWGLPASGSRRRSSTPISGPSLAHAVKTVERRCCDRRRLLCGRIRRRARRTRSDTAVWFYGEGGGPKRLDLDPASDRTAPWRRASVPISISTRSPSTSTLQARQVCPRRPASRIRAPCASCTGSARRSGRATAIASICVCRCTTRTAA